MCISNYIVSSLGPPNLANPRRTLLTNIPRMASYYGRTLASALCPKYVAYSRHAGGSWYPGPWLQRDAKLQFLWKHLPRCDGPGFRLGPE